MCDRQRGSHKCDIKSYIERFHLDIRYSKSELNQDYDNNLKPIRAATKITNKEVIKAKVLLDKNFIFK